MLFLLPQGVDFKAATVGRHIWAGFSGVEALRRCLSRRRKTIKQKIQLIKKDAMILLREGFGMLKLHRLSGGTAAPPLPFLELVTM